MRTIECPLCLGARKVFVCARWVSSNGHCCPGGTHQPNCPGNTVICQECDLSGPDAGRSAAIRLLPALEDRCLEPPVTGLSIKKP